MSARVPGRLVDPARGAAQSLWQGAKNVVYASRFYNYSLKGRHPNRLRVRPVDLWPGSERIGNALFRGDYELAGSTIALPNTPPWAPEGADQAWLEAVHGFDWLRHFRACEGDAARRHVQALIRSWLEAYNSWHPLAWRPQVLATRLIAWMCHEPLTISSPDLVYRSAVLNSIARQARHLARVADCAPAGLARLTAMVGAVYGGLCLPDGDRRLARAITALESELDTLVLADGGFASRNPSDHFAALQLLIALRETLLRAHREDAVMVQTVIDRMAGMLRLFRHGDGGLALFNGGFEDSPEEIGRVLKLTRTRARAPAAAPNSGYQNLEAGRTKVLIDTGRAPEGDLSLRAHAGVLGFEMSTGKTRLVVNCGSIEVAARTRAWDRVSRSSAAHSTLVINNRNSALLLDSGRVAEGPQTLTVERNQEDGAIWLDASHDGYMGPCGLVHRRRLYLDASGDDLRGEDMIVGPGAARARGLEFDVRFHLHPRVRSSIVQNGQSVLLRLRRGEGWRFEARGGRVRVEESVYLGLRGVSRKCQQIVVSGRLDGGETRVNWSFKRVEPGT